MKSARPKAASKGTHGKHRAEGVPSPAARGAPAASDPSPELAAASDFLELLVRHDYVTPASALMTRRFMSRWGVSALVAMMS
jgi:hypothetical protein